jgi:hypothetical protein
MTAEDLIVASVMFMTALCILLMALAIRIF